MISINWWVREDEIIDNIKNFHHNQVYLSSVELPPEKLFLSKDITEIIKRSDYLIFAIPSAFLYSSIKEIKPDKLKEKIIISAIKGIVPEHNVIIGEFFNQEYKLFNLEQLSCGKRSFTCGRDSLLEKLTLYP